MLMLTIVLYLILRAREKPRLIQYAGIPLAFSYVVRPADMLSLVVLSLYVLFTYRRYFLRFLLGVTAVAVPFCIFNLSVYGSLVSPYYLHGEMASGVSAFFEALAGNLVSPGRGLFVFTPVFLFALLGVALKVRHGKIDRLDYYLAVIIFLHWILISGKLVWWAGHSFGPRYFSDMVPYFIYFLIPVLVFEPERGKWKKWLLNSALVLSIALSFFINFSGATFDQNLRWNYSPDNIDKNPARVWDWHDLQFLRWRQG
jgi:hypothetical protein